MKKLLFAFAVVAGVFTGVAHADNNCTGATYYDSDTDTCIACPAGYDYNQDAGKTDVTQCQIHCDGGTFAPGYTQLEYIESSGRQWVDTGVTFNSNIGYEFEYQPITTNTFVTQAGTTGQVIAQLGNVWEFRFNGGNNRRPNSATIDLTKFVNIKYNINNKCSVDDKIVDISDLTLNAGGNIRLFGPNYSSSGRMKFFKIYDNGVLSNNFIPARRNSDGVVGMYDTVTGTFFANSGTGTFVAGADIGGCVNVGAGFYAPASTVNFGSVGTRTACPAGTYSNISNGTSVAACTPCSGATYADETAATSCKSCPNGYDYNQDAGKDDITDCQIHCDAGTYVVSVGVPVPSNYTPLEYIESTGTQYINTGIDETSIDYIELDFEAQSADGLMFVNGSTQVGMSQSRYGTTTINTKYQIKQELVGNRWYFTNITNGVTYTQPWPQSNNVLYLFAMGGGAASNYTHAKVYGFSCYSNGTLYCNFIPVRRNSDGIIGMYDTVTGIFFTNSGTGTFIAGQDISNGCTNVGAGYWAAATTVNFGSLGTKNACPVGLYTVGYGHGADEANDCGRILHVGDNVIYTRRNKETTPSVNIKMDNGDMFYISLSPTDHTVSRLHFQYNGNEYTAYDDGLYYGERNFDTGEQIAQ